MPRNGKSLSEKSSNEKELPRNDKSLSEKSSNEKESQSSNEKESQGEKSTSEELPLLEAQSQPSQSENPTNQKLGFIEDKDGALRVEDIVVPPPPVATLSHDVPDKRLVITKLKIKNFKSYANEIILGPFDKNFTAVVGPNGSGKSNVIDSLLFVFGYRAKKIRSKKVSHLIHKSDQHSDVNSCTVRVYFAMIKEQGDDYEIIPGSEFVVSKTAFTDDTSFYEMNNKRVAYKEVAKALRHYGIDLEHSRFLILQGEIEAISLMPPKGEKENESGMLEFVEDIIGTNRYIEPIQKFKEKLDKLNEEKAEKLNSLKLVEKEKDELEGPKNDAVEYLRLENKIILNENSLLHYRRFKTEKQLEEISEKKKIAEEKVNEVKAEISNLKKSCKTHEDDLEKIISELDVNEKNNKEYKETYKRLEREDVAMHEEIKHIKAKKSKIESSLTTAKNELTKLSKQLETYEKETGELKKMKEKLDADKTVEEKKLSEVMNSVQTETNIIQDKKDALEEELVKVNKAANNVQSEMELKQSELQIYTRTKTKEKQKLENLISSDEEMEKKSKEEEKLLKKEEQERLMLQAKIDELVQKISESQQNDVEFSEQLKDFRNKLEDARSSLNTFNNRSGILQAFAKEKARGRFTGVLGRLGDLGAIDEKYDIAISTACGHLDSIVTDTVDTATQCIEYLKKNNLGYSHFIPLEKMTVWHKQAHSTIETPENVPRLFDLVRVKDESVLPAFYYALKDCLVANNLEQATRIGLQQIKRYRVVTLKGELIDLSGTMSGGGGKVSKGRMGQTVVECTHTPEDVARINQEVDRLSKELANNRKQILEMQDQISTITKRLSTLNLSVKKRRSNHTAFLANAEMLKTQIEEQKKKILNVSVDEEKIAELKENISKKKKIYDEYAKKAAQIQEKVSSMQEEILKVTKGSLGKVKKSVDLLSKKISEISQAISKSEVNAKTCKKNIKKAEEKIKNAEKELENASAAKTKLDAKREKSVCEAKEILLKQQEAEKAEDKLREKKAEVKKALESYREKEHQLKLDEIKQKNDLKELESIEKDKQAAIRSFIAKIKKLKLNEVENDSTEIPSLSPEEIEKLKISDIERDSELMKVQIEDKHPNLSAIAEYKKKEAICNEKQKDLNAVLDERNLQNARYEELRKRRLTEFMKGFTIIAKKLKETYQMLTLGGDAEMELVDTFDPFAKGIEFSVRPPKKSWKFMRNLSGGEKTLSSLSLVFALHYYRPTPFYVMDEIDAALDVRNVAIVGYFLKERTKNTQFIIVSLRNIMNELADHLIGIFKISNCSRNVSIKRTNKWKEEDENKEKV